MKFTLTPSVFSRHSKSTWGTVAPLGLLIAEMVLLWVGLAGLLNQFLIHFSGAPAYGFMNPGIAFLLLVGSGFVYLLRVGIGKQLLWEVLLVIDVICVYLALWWSPDLLGSSHAFVNVASFSAISAVIIAAVGHDRKGSGDEQKLLRSKSVWLVATIGVLLSVLMACLLVQRDLSQARGYSKNMAESLGHSLEIALNQPVLAVQRMRNRWQKLDDDPGKAYIEQEFFSHISSIDAIKRLSVITEKGDIDSDLKDESVVSDALEQASKMMAFWAFLDRVAKDGKAMMSTPGLVASNPKFAFVAAPIGSGYPDHGWLVATVDLDDLVKGLFDNDELPCCFAVLVNDVHIYTSHMSPDLPVLASAQDEFAIGYSLPVKVLYWKEKQPGEIGLSYYPFVALVIGLTLTFFAVVGVGFARLATYRAALLSVQAGSDPLTGLPNRRILEKKLRELFDNSSIGKSMVGVMLVDLRGVRLINDSLGHEVADHLLRVLSHRFMDVLPKDALLARLDGGEFVVAMRIKDDKELEQLAKDILETLTKPVEVQDQQVSVSTLIGITTAYTPPEDVLQLVREADMAMIQTKTQGQQHWTFYTPAMGDSAALRLMLAQELKQAIASGQLMMHYQPIVDVRSGRIVSLEGLVRWNHPHQGAIPPNMFVPVAEETGQIGSLSRWVLSQVCQDILWLSNSAHVATVPVAVNISPAHFEQKDFLAQIRAVIETFGVKPQQIQLEITEGVLMRNQDDAVSKLTALREEGILISLDDFGTGYSGLSYLKNLPIQKIKLDRSFVENVSQNVTDFEIVKGVIHLAHKLSLKVVVEGVESVEQARLLSEMQADQLQGYLFSRPVDREKLASLLAQTDLYAEIFSAK